MASLSTIKLESLTPTERQAIRLLAAAHSPAADYVDDPVGWCRRFLKGFEPNFYQIECLELLQEKKRLAVYGPHGLGKTSGISAPAVLWFATTREAAGIEWQTLTTAAVGRQLRQFLWPGIRRLIRQIDFDELGIKAWQHRREYNDMSINLLHGHAHSASAEDPDKIEGVHGKHVLIVLDEAKGIQPEIWDALEGAYANAGEDTESEAWGLATSTPGTNQSRLYDISQNKPGLEDWHVRPVTKDEAVEAGRLSPEWVEKRGRQWGTDSAIYKNKCLGEFADASDESAIQYEWIEDAHRRWHKHNQDDSFERWDGPLTIGLDPAREGGDKTGRAYYLPHLDAVWKIDLEERTPNLAVLGRHAAHQTRAGTLIVDTAGLGAGVYDAAARTAACSMIEFSPASKTKWRDVSGMLTAANKRSAAYWSMFDRLNPENDPTLALPENEEFVGELLAQKVMNRAADSNLIRLVSKDLIKKNLGRSPDSYDAVSYALWREPVSRVLRSVPTRGIVQQAWPAAV